MGFCRFLPHLRRPFFLPSHNDNRAFASPDYHRQWKGIPMQSHLARSAINIGLLLLVNLCWSTQFVAFRMVADEMGPITISFLMYLIAVPIVFALYFAERWSGKGVMPNVSRADRSLLRWRNWLGFLVIGVLAAAPGSMLSAAGIARTSASHGALLSLTVPVITALLAAIILSERMTVARWVSLACALSGALVLSMKSQGGDAAGGNLQNAGAWNASFLVGILLILAAYTTNGLYNVCSKGLLSRFSAIEVLAIGFGLVLLTDFVMLVCFEPLSLATLQSYSVRTWTGVLLLGVVCSALGTVLWLYALTRLDVGQAVVSVYLLPFFGVLLAAVFLHEHITLPMILGGVITLIGTILVVSIDGSKPKPEELHNS
jgi:drug/metabolite transporter (DMT)-like permease